ncbi:hypothetical protein GE21DRAFT_9483 [Neurospora crassa]|uniref:Uncharacterized protein n=2 Tax=Neurospora crassa TaxID=5141 RepID=V5IKV2_NEUCR|nr:hypothetical protein NCU12137 [Neurospora crassa OR74A]ESA42308.1 hypothetical protein NCU12137 [Neurospora crassa OR74A]KHE87993.1 hypothetical protein GE21DRAFT_9483 [Neurospora crassa]|eukprot:XP_011395063.1 hypothetical protein NCU12137 [Neurospora crassa OR74A]
MPQHGFRNAIRLLKAKQHKWKRSLCKKLAWLKTKSNSHDLDTIIPIKPEGYPIPAIRATRRFPIDDFSDSDSDSDSDSEEEEDLVAESSSSPLDDGSSSRGVYDVPPSCQTQNSACSTLSSTSTLASASQTETETEIETETSPEIETDDSNVPERPEPEVLNTFSGRFSSFRKSTCTASTRDSYVTAASYLDSDSAGDKHEDEHKDEDEHEDESDPGPGLDSDESIRSDTSNTSFFESESRDSRSDTSMTSVSSISC